MHLMVAGVCPCSGPHTARAHERNDACHFHQQRCLLVDPVYNCKPAPPRQCLIAADVQFIILRDKECAADALDEEDDNTAVLQEVEEALKAAPR